MFLTDTDAVCELARKSQGIKKEEMEDGRNVRVLYRLKSGKEVERLLWIDFADASNERPDIRREPSMYSESCHRPADLR